VIAAMLRPPLRSTDYEGGFGTLYTAGYRPTDRAVEYSWPGSTWRHSLQDFKEGTFRVELEPATAPA
jgi:hypothetical protein